MITQSGGGGVNDLFMDPSGPLWPLGIHQTDANRKGGRTGRKVEEEREIEERNLEDRGGGKQMEGWKHFKQDKCSRADAFQQMSALEF